MSRKEVTICLLLALASFAVADRKEGDYIIGASLPIRKVVNGTCSQINYEGLAVSEAIRFAITEINSDHKLLGVLTVDRKLGYDIRDNCDSVEKEKDIAYSFNDVKRAHRKIPVAQKPVSVVIGRFRKESVPVMRLLKFEKIPQISYDAANFNLQQVGTNNEDAKELVSTFPEDETKAEVMSSIIEASKFEFTHVMAINNAEGKAWMKHFGSKMSKSKRCFSSNNLFSTEDDIKQAVRSIAENKLIKVVAFYGSKSEELVAIKEAEKLNLTDVIFLSSNSWDASIEEARPYATQVEGMVSVVATKPNVKGFETYIEDDKKPLLNDSILLENVLQKVGAPRGCGQNSAALSAGDVKKCKKAKVTLRKELIKNKQVIAYAIDAVYLFANALQDMLTGKNKTSLLDAMKKVDFESPMTKNKVKVDADGNVIAQSFILMNFHGNMSSTLTSAVAGHWKRDNEPKLFIDKDVLKWKDGKKKNPVSKCSRDCLKGEGIKYPMKAPLCCWSCVQCPNFTFSNTTNSKCSKCPVLYTPNPAKSKCIEFKQIHLSISNPLAEFAMFLVVIGILFTFFSMYILNQNKDCKIMKMADNETIQTHLLGVLIILISSVPLLATPSVNMCIIYGCVFNAGLTIALAALISKTWLIRSSFYHEDGTFKPTAFSTRPGFCVGLIIIILHAILLGVGTYMEKVYIAYDNTKDWDVMYLECSLFREYVFWFSYGFNIGLSILINFFNCGVPDVEARFGEYNWLCLTTCVYYAVAFVYVLIFFAFKLVVRVEVCIIVTVLHAFVFLVAYVLPKLHMVLFMPEEKMKELGGPDRQEKAPLIFVDEDDEALMQMVAHAGGGDVFKRSPIIVKVQPDSEGEA